MLRMFVRWWLDIILKSNLKNTSRMKTQIVGLNFEFCFFALEVVPWKLSYGLSLYWAWWAITWALLLNYSGPLAQAELVYSTAM